MYAIITWLEENFLKLGLFDNINKPDQKFEIPAEIIERAEERKIAKQKKHYGKSDMLREEINKKGWNIKDTEDGYEITKA